MKCLSLWQPWATALFLKDYNGVPIKPDETRGWPTNVRGTIAIHAAKKRTRAGKDFNDPLKFVLQACGLSLGQLPYGAVIGTIDIVACSMVEQVAARREEWQLQWGDYRPYGDNGKRRYAFEMSNAVLLPCPVPCVGRQGFFEVKI